MNNLLALTGQKGSGKDTVAIILAMLYHNHDNHVILKTIEHDLTVYSDNYKIKKFAQPIKEFVANILGVDVAMMEDREFKETSLGEKWVRHVLYVDRDGDLEIRDMFSTYEELERLYGNHKDGAGAYVYKKEFLTPRTLMQLIGTEVCRQIHPNFWINSLFKDYTPTGDTLLEGEIRKVREEDLIYPKWIISDCRFNNEAEAIKSKGGVIIKVERDLDNQDSHKSEKGIDKKYVDLVINNNGSIQDLITEVKNKMNG